MKNIMQAALNEAQKARSKEEVPIGCVIVKNGKIIARGHNLRETKKDPLAHAELIAIKKASKKIGDWRLNMCELFVTLEPCPLCAQAIIQARIPKVYFGTPDPKFRSSRILRKNKVAVKSGIMTVECKKILQDFFIRTRTRTRRKERWLSG
ncbi:nucleoside deaminase [Candidatus Margulisiibacteriota bacterium]